MDDSHINQRFEDVEDLMDYSQGLLLDAIFFYCLTSKLGLTAFDKKVLKALLLSMVEIEFEDTYDKVIPHVEKDGNSSVIYGFYKEK